MIARKGRTALTGFLTLSLAGTVALIGLSGSAGASDAKLPKLVETVVIDAGDQDGVWSAAPLTEGIEYELRASGTFTYGQGDSAADAECSQLLPDETWQSNRYAAMTNYRDVLDLYLDHDPVDWQPTDGNALGCNRTDHTYRHSFTMPETRHIRLFVRDLDGSYHENSGGLVVRIRQIGPIVTGVDGRGSTPAAASAPPPTAPKPVTKPAATPGDSGSEPAELGSESSGAVADAAAAAITADRSELALADGVLPAGPAVQTLPSAPSTSHELLAVLALASWLAVAAMIIRRFQFVVVPAGTHFYAGPPPQS